MKKLTPDELLQYRLGGETMREQVERLEAENDKLRAELLKAPNAQMVAFIAAFEVWLEYVNSLSLVECGSLSTQATYAEMQDKYNELKARHLGAEVE